MSGVIRRTAGSRYTLYSDHANRAWETQRPERLDRRMEPAGFDVTDCTECFGMDPSKVFPVLRVPADVQWATTAGGDS